MFLNDYIDIRHSVMEELMRIDLKVPDDKSPHQHERVFPVDDDAVEADDVVVVDALLHGGLLHKLLRPALQLVAAHALDRHLDLNTNTKR